MKKIYLKNKQIMQLNSQPIKYRIIKLDKKKRVMVNLSWHDKLIILVIRVELTRDIPLNPRSIL